MAKKKQKNKGKVVVKPTIADNISSEVIAAAYSAASQPAIPVFLKVCRLCESKDGPFLNIFDADKVTAKKIDDLMPFSITENDDLPHKICFRCSAKLEELYEFIQKCIKTQENLRSAIGTSGPFITKSNQRKKLWEEKLNKSNMSNDDICDALIKKAMEGIKSIVPKTEETTEQKRVTRSRESTQKKEMKAEPKSDDTDDVSLKQVKLSLESNDKPVPSKVTRSNRLDAQAKKSEPSQPKKSVTPQPKKGESSKKAEVSQSSSDSHDEPKSTEPPPSSDCGEPATPPVKESNAEEEKKEEDKKPFNIMDHISMIKVNGVGVLFQCKLCNRNFLKKEVVESHNCAKNGAPKINIPKSVPAPEPPKVPSVKYIKIDGDMKKSLTEKVKMAQKIENEKISARENSPTKDDKDDSYEPPPKIKPKPRAGPASKTKRVVIDSDSSSTQNAAAQSPNTEPPVSVTPPSVHFPAMPNLNGRFKLVPGPNNIFTLVEDTSVPVTAVQTPAESSKKPGRKRKSDEIGNVEVKPKDRITIRDSPEVIDVEDQSQPYPVGLFQTVSHGERLYEPSAPAAPPTFTTPAMKKQSYTIVQTGDPSKLLISTKAKAVDVEVPKKRQKKTKPDVREDSPAKEPFTVTLEDVAPPKDAGFFTFINVDPLLQPSYVLPTDNIIQESQISTSSAVICNPTDSKESKDKYTCNMCGLHFSREKKLLSHIQSHYSKMDEEDQIRSEKSPKKKGRK